MTYKNFSKIIKSSRVEMGLTQKDVIKQLGISQSYYSKIESGEQEPNFLLLTRIIKFYKIDFNDILKNDKESKLNNFD